MKLLLIVLGKPLLGVIAGVAAVTVPMRVAQEKAVEVEARARALEAELLRIEEAQDALEVPAAPGEVKPPEHKHEHVEEKPEAQPDQ